MYDPPVFMWFSYWNHNFERMSNCDVWWPEGMSIPYLKNRSQIVRNMILVFVIALWCFLEVALKDVIKYSHVTRCFSPTSRDVFQTSSWESYSTRSILQSVCHIKINIKYIGNLWVVNSLFQIYKPYWSLAPGQVLCKIIEVNGIVNQTNQPI